MPEPLAAANPAEVVAIYKLKENRSNLLEKGFGENSGSTEKRVSNVNLFEWQWEYLDEISDSSRNAALREVLEMVFDQGKSPEEFRQEIALEVLEEVRARATSEDVRQAIDQAENKVMDDEQ